MQDVREVAIGKKVGMSTYDLDQTNRTWDDTDQLAAWDAYYRKNGITPAPTDHPIPDSWAVVMILFLGVVVPWVIVIAAVRWAVS